MRNLLRAGVLAAGAAGFCLAFSLSASADVVEPNSPYQPASVGLMEEKAGPVDEAPTAGGSAEPAVAPEAKGEAAKPAPKPVEAKAQAAEVEPTPAPETVVRQAPAVPVARTVAEQEARSSAVARVLNPLRAGFEQIGASVGRVVSACDVGFGTGAGGPVLVLAVLGIATPFIRRRVIATRWTTDDDVPELLYASELTPPG